DDGEVIELWAERPDKPFDRDTELTLTDVELTENGLTTLAEALQLVPEINVRNAGRGGNVIDIRGARRGSNKVLVDGVAVSDPWYGTFDVSSVPVTDIVQIRVAPSPSSPIDGPGGTGGVIEIHTRDAIGPRRLDTRILGSSAPEGNVSGTGRAMLGARWAVRPSVSVDLGSYDFPMESASVDEDRRETHGGLRVEYRRGKRRLVVDLAGQQRSYIVPPSENLSGDIRDIDGETTARAAVTADDQLGAWRLQGRVFAFRMTRSSVSYGGYERYQDDAPSFIEDLSATHLGASFLANRPLRKRFRLITSATVLSGSADVANQRGLSGDNPRTTEEGGRSTISEVAAGLQWEDGPLRIDSAAGLAVPIGVGDGPWPEFKLSAWYRAMPGITFKAIGARKGRIPTLRELYRSDTGNQDLDPEFVWFGELAVELRPSRWVELSSSAYMRDATGLIKLQLGDDGMNQLVNLDDLLIRGLDHTLLIAPREVISLGGSWSYVNPAPMRNGDEPFDFMPRHRARLWLSARPVERAQITARVSYVGQRFDGGTALPGVTLVELVAHSTIGRGLSANLRIDNLADTRWNIRNNVFGPGRTAILSLYGQWQ
ncbi:MAG: TonB-dependent receptor, partial [Myxococcota bacterium]